MFTCKSNYIVTLLVVSVNSAIEEPFYLCYDRADIRKGKSIAIYE